MYAEPREIPPLPEPEEVSGRSVAALIFAVLGLAHLCPCAGPVIAIALGSGERNGVGKAAVVIGLVGLGVDALIGLVSVAFLLRMVVSDWLF